MKNVSVNIVRIFLLAMCVAAVCVRMACAETATQMATMQTSVSSVLSIEFYSDANIPSLSTIPFTNIDPTKTTAYPDGRTSGDGKSDTGIICLSNMNVPWYLKVGASTSTQSFPINNFKYYMGQPWNRNTSQQADGTLARQPSWSPIPTAPTAVYTCGTIDMNNLPYGTLCTFSFAIDTSTLLSGTLYLINITYTITTTP